MIEEIWSALLKYIFNDWSAFDDVIVHFVIQDSAMVDDSRLNKKNCVNQMWSQNNQRK